MTTPSLTPPDPRLEETADYNAGWDDGYTAGWEAATAYYTGHRREPDAIGRPDKPLAVTVDPVLADAIARCTGGAA